MDLLKKYGLEIPKILLPNKDIDVKKWAVIACDQYTQDNDYWDEVLSITKSTPSTLHLILPEIYLNDAEKKQSLTKSIHRTMQEYLDSSVFQDEQSCFTYIERKTAYGRNRKGLVVAIDLEAYDWKPFSKNLIRATEATIIDRIPPRVEIRKNASLESPHIMLLVNDSDKVLVEQVGLNISKNVPTYKSDLMMNGGHITGWSITEECDFEKIEKALSHIAQNNTDSDGSVFMFAVGDGNHSLATAKAVWDEVKTSCNNIETAKERFALVEIVNIFDEGLTFEPIHRVLFNTDSEKFISFIKETWNVETTNYNSFDDLENYILNNPSSFALINRKDEKMTHTCVHTDKKGLLVSHLQPLIDDFMQGKNTDDIDYIHGSDEVCRLANKENTIGLLLPPIEKDSFFATIENNGPLPRKSFSMGEADEKRFYMECRRLINN